MTGARTDASRHQIPLRLPEDDYTALRSLAYFTEQSMNAIVCTAVHEYLQTIGRRDLIAASTGQAQTAYRALLDKLGDM